MDVFPPRKVCCATAESVSRRREAWKVALVNVSFEGECDEEASPITIGAWNGLDGQR